MKSTADTSSVVHDRQASWPNPVTFCIPGLGLGDTWRIVQYACHVNETQDVEVNLYAGWHGWPGLDFSSSPTKDRTALIREITPLLDTRGRFRLVRKADLSKVVFTQWFSYWGFPNVPSRIRWKGWLRRARLRLACQLDGVVGAKQKNPLRVDLSRLMTPLPGVEVVPLGRHLSVRSCLEMMSSSDVFFGVDSGMMQLAYSVGVPAFLLRYREDGQVLWKWHGDRHAIHCCGTDDFLHLVRIFLGREV